MFLFVLNFLPSLKCKVFFYGKLHSFEAYLNICVMSSGVMLSIRLIASRLSVLWIRREGLTNISYICKEEQNSILLYCPSLLPMDSLHISKTASYCTAHPYFQWVVYTYLKLESIYVTLLLHLFLLGL